MSDEAMSDSCVFCFGDLVTPDASLYFGTVRLERVHSRTYCLSEERQFSICVSCLDTLLEQTERMVDRPNRIRTKMRRMAKEMAKDFQRIRRELPKGE